MCKLVSILQLFYIRQVSRFKILFFLTYLNEKYTSMIIWYLFFTVNYNTSINLRVNQTSKSCMEVKWQKKDAGRCKVKYTVKFENSSGETLYEETGTNIARKMKCGIPHHVNITRVVLTLTSFKRSKTYITDFQRPTPGERSNLYLVYLYNFY